MAQRSVPEWLRVVGAGLFVFAGLLAAVAVAGILSPEDDGTASNSSGVLLGLCMVACGAVLTIAAMVLFNRGGWSYVSGRDPDALVRTWEEDGLLDSATYSATRAFQVEEAEDEGLHFFLELTDGSVLYLNGQYLYDYEEIVDDVEVPIPRRFPCTDFTVRTYRPGRYVVDLVCTGKAFEPEVVTPPFSDWGKIDDHTVITDRSYDELKDERLTSDEGRPSA